MATGSRQWLSGKEAASVGPRAEAQRARRRFRLGHGVGRFNALIPAFGGNLLDNASSADRGGCRNHLTPASKTLHAPLCASARVLPIQSRSSFSCSRVEFSDRRSPASTLSCPPIRVIRERAGRYSPYSEPAAPLGAQPLPAGHRRRRRSRLRPPPPPSPNSETPR